MLKLSKQINNIRSFQLNKGLITNLNNELNSIYENSPTPLGINILWLKEFNNLTIGLDSLNKPSIIIDKKIDYKLIDLFRISSVNYPYFTFYEKTNPRTYGVYNFNLEKIEFKTNNLIGKEIFNKYLINDNQGLIEIRKINSENIINSFSIFNLPPIPLKEFANEDVPWEIKKIIGVLDNKLWVAMNHRTIIAISIETGDLVHIISEIPNFEMEWIHNSIPVPEATQIIENEKILLGFVDAFVWKINAETGEISIKDFTPYFKENRIMNYRNEFIIDKELLFFLSDTDSKVGCFNRNTEQLEWQHAFDKDETGYAPRLLEIQGNRNKLGVKDLNNSLYIFESVS